MSSGRRAADCKNRNPCQYSRSLESSYFSNQASSCEGIWLAVVNVDDRNNHHAIGATVVAIARITVSLLPGTNVRLSFPSTVRTAMKPSEIATGWRLAIDQATGDGYGTNSGTSMAAPIVSGALAVLKSKDPLTVPEGLKARQVVDILPSHRDRSRRCAGNGPGLRMGPRQSGAGAAAHRPDPRRRRRCVRHRPDGRHAGRLFRRLRRCRAIGRASFRCF